MIVTRIIRKKKIKFKRKKPGGKYFNKRIKYIKSSFIICINIIILCLSTLTTTKRKAFDEFKPHKVFIEAHRGVNEIKFENTIEAISLAIKYRLDSFETDAWLCKDNILVLIHNCNTNNYYNATYNVMFTEWKKLAIMQTKRGNLSMPKLEDVMKLTKNKIYMNLDIKDPRVDLVFPYITNLIEKYNYFDQISLSSFNHGYYSKVVEYNLNNTYGKKISFGFLYGGGSISQFYNYYQRNHTINAYWSKLTKDVCDKAHANGMAVLAWFYMGDKEDDEIYKTLFDNGIDILCTNFPLRAKKFRHYYYKKKKLL